jgi:hypothetical protein
MYRWYMCYAFSDTIAGVKLCQLGNNYDYGILKFLRGLRDVPHNWRVLGTT